MGHSPSLYTTPIHPRYIRDMQDLDYKILLHANSTWTNESNQACKNLPATRTEHRSRNLTCHSVRNFFFGWDEFDNYLQSDITGNQTKTAPCHFPFRKFRSHHFPHAVETIYRCISFWQSYLDLQPVMVHPADHEHFPPSHLTTQQSKIDYYKNNPNVTRPLLFFEGMLLALMEVLNVRLMEDDKDVPRITPILPKNMHQKGFDLHNPEALRSLRNDLASYYNGKSTDSEGRNRGIQVGACQSVPRIAMLTREMDARGRKMPNEKALAKAITEHLKTWYSLQKDDDTPLVHFVNTSFLNQVSFFSSVDILVASHGAQNTGVGFLPQCGGIIELFPQGIQFPNYFGTLAQDSGLEYMLYYVSDADMHIDRDRGHTFNKGLGRNHLCPVPEDLLEGSMQ